VTIETSRTKKQREKDRRGRGQGTEYPKTVGLQRCNIYIMEISEERNRRSI